MATVAAAAGIIAELGDRLVLRRSTPADTEALVAFNAEVHRERTATAPDEGIAAWARDLLARPHPTFCPDDFTVVEDTRSGAIVSCLNLIPQTWAYGGVELGVGRIEMVGTHPDYRRRGLVRRQFEVVHRWSAERGHLAQAITGIPWYYRQFGYELGLALGGGRAGYRHHIPGLAPGEAEPFRVRPATAADVPFLLGVDAHARQRYLVTCVRDAALWRYEIDGRSRENTARRDVGVIETAAGEGTGFLVYRPLAGAGTTIAVTAYELAPGASWLAVTPSVLRFLGAAGEAYERQAPAPPGGVPPPAPQAPIGLASSPPAAPAAESPRRFESVAFNLGGDHPVYRAIADRVPVVTRPYAWYVRVPDLPAFVRRVAPVLEAHLAASELAGYSGEVRLSFYRTGMRLAFAGGRLAAAEPWREPDHTAGAAFPDLTFLQLLFGYRTLDELEYAFADCRARTEARALLGALFPKQPSLVWPVA